MIKIKDVPIGDEVEYFDTVNQENLELIIDKKHAGCVRCLTVLGEVKLIPEGTEVFWDPDAQRMG